jgi:hypothetical protein
LIIPLASASDGSVQFTITAVLLDGSTVGVGIKTGIASPVLELIQELAVFPLSFSANT